MTIMNRKRKSESNSFITTSNKKYRLWKWTSRSCGHLCCVKKELLNFHWIYCCHSINFTTIPDVSLQTGSATCSTHHKHTAEYEQRKWIACERCARHSGSLSRWERGGGLCQDKLGHVSSIQALGCTDVHVCVCVLPVEDCWACMEAWWTRETWSHSPDRLYTGSVFQLSPLLNIHMHINDYKDKCTVTMSMYHIENMV